MLPSLVGAACAFLAGLLALKWLSSWLKGPVVFVRDLLPDRSGGGRRITSGGILITEKIVKNFGRTTDSRRDVVYLSRSSTSVAVAAAGPLSSVRRSGAKAPRGSKAPRGLKPACPIWQAFEHFIILHWRRDVATCASARGRRKWAACARHLPVCGFTLDTE